MSDVYTAPATPASVAARLAALEQHGGLEALVIRLYRILLMGSQKQTISNVNKMSYAEMATVFDGGSWRIRKYISIRSPFRVDKRNLWYWG